MAAKKNRSVKPTPAPEPVGKPTLLDEVAAHFKPLALNELITASHRFPIASRVDLQIALDYLLSETYAARLIGVHRMYNQRTLTFSDLLNGERDSLQIGPLQYIETDIGEAMPARCLRQGVWLCRKENLNFSVLLSEVEDYGDGGAHVEIAVPAGDAGMQLSRAIFDNIQKLVNESRSFRGKVISLEGQDRYGSPGAVKVHKLPTVPHNGIVLPDQTLRLLDQNITTFIKQRDNLKKLGMATKKGLLFYGPPGTGKTHLIHYLARRLAGHTTLLCTRNQLEFLDHYLQLAQLLQPTILVIENVTSDGIDRLLNGLDDLREDTATLIVLTTNRAEQLEAALASRAGRIDQAIEFPLPDEEGRRKLVRLYANGMELTDDLVNVIARKTDHASPAFIKEFMRRAAQYLLQTTEGARLSLKHVEAALDEMLVRGGAMNRKLLGVSN